MKAVRIAVTGRGLMTGLGLDLAASWGGLMAGRSVAAPFRQFIPVDLPTTFGVELPPEAAELFSSRIKTHTRRQMTRATMIAVLTAEAALAESGLLASGIDRTRIGVSVGASGTGYAPQTLEPDSNRILLNMNNAPAAWISIRNGLSGPSLVSSTACSSGAFALSMGIMLIQSGQCEAMIVGSAESIINQSDVGGFCSLMAMSTEGDNPAGAARPFDALRDGFVMGEGGGMLVLESWDAAVARGAKILAEAHLPGLCSEAYNILSPAPGGVGMMRAMGLALSQAGLKAAEIGYINAHGTGTPLNDLAETQAIKEVFGQAAGNIPVSSTKSMTGHTLSGAAGVESVIAVTSLVEQRIPPTINLHHPDPELDLDYVPHHSRPACLRHVMSNSFAFGGHNGVCIFSTPDTAGAGR